MLSLRHGTSRLAADADCPSNAIVPLPRPWLPEHTAAAGSAITLALATWASIAVSSKHSATFAFR
jgi:hypothetical protein